MSRDDWWEGRVQNKEDVVYEKGKVGVGQKERDGKVEQRGGGVRERNDRRGEVKG